VDFIYPLKIPVVRKSQLRLILFQPYPFNSIPKYPTQVAALSGTTTPTVNGQAMPVKVNKVDQVVSVDIAKIVKADIKCLNGLIHVIDTVMMPKA
jgi:uncharacterized surface protein with fasciclin (FAS1) repeats